MASSTQTTSQDEEAVRSLVIPLTGLNLLLPNTAVAEVVAYAEPKSLPEAAPWMLGMVEWRGLNIPLLAYEVFTGVAASHTAGAKRLAIFNTLNGNDRLPFLAVATQGIPRSLRVSEGGVDDAAPASEPGLSCRLELQGVKLAIPDLDAVEAALAQGGVTVTPVGG